MSVFKRLDGWLMLFFFLFCATSLLILYSAGQSQLFFLKRQLIHFCIGLLVVVFFAHLPLRYLEKIVPIVFVVCLVLLLMVKFVGVSSGGAQRWLSFGFIRFQPSELLKIVSPMMVAWSVKNIYFGARVQFFMNVSIILLAVSLVAIQPDLGTAILISVSGFLVLIFSNISLLRLFIAAGLGVLMTPALWYFMKDYQKQRVLSFLSPEQDPLGSGYHIIQSKIAIGSGGLFGKGYLQGTQSSLDFLPEPHTDFIFSVLAEEWGLWGVLCLFALYGFMFARSLWICMQTRDVFERLLGVSLTFTFLIYMLINIGMVSGLLPVVGLPLPLISYGGTSVVTIAISFGILMSIKQTTLR